MSKSIKVLSVVLIIFSFIISFYGVYATDINMNLPTTNQDSNVTSSPDLVNSIGSNTYQNTQDIVPSSVDSNASSTVTPSSISGISEEGLGLTNILSILLITVGVILILLAIAIMIRLK